VLAKWRLRIIGQSFIGLAIISIMDLEVVSPINQTLSSFRSSFL
jgi:hypothetical protein